MIAAVSDRAVEDAQRMSPTLSLLDADAVRSALTQQIAEAAAFERWVHTTDRSTGDPQRIVWLSHGPDEPRWCGAVLRDRQIVRLLRVGEARSLIKETVRRQARRAALEREDNAAEDVLLRYRSRGVPGVEAVEVLRDGTARYVLTVGEAV